VRRVGPGPVEDELAVAVGLEVEGNRADEAAAPVSGRDQARDAACAGPDAPRGLERGQKSVLEEGVAGADQAVPFVGRDVADALYNLEVDG